MDQRSDGLPRASSAPEGAGLGSGGALKIGWIAAGRSGAALPTPYRDVDGWAIYDGCVILGRTAALQANANAVAADPRALINRLLGNVLVGEQFRWSMGPSGFYEVPYVLEASIDEALRGVIAQAAEHWSGHTKIRLRSKVPGDTDWISFVRSRFCASAVGRQGSRQEIWLAPGCTTGNVIHEIGHAVGLWHEHTRGDRDQYVQIQWANIEPEARSNFTARADDSQAVGDYDYDSIMHYPADAFALDPTKPTIVAPSDGAGMGQRNGLSSEDIRTVATLYP